MISVRKSAERGRFQADWLDSRHTFSFDTYYDPQHMGFRALRVINEDRVEAGGGFPLHPHRDMEILSLVIEGKLEHQDDLGSRETIRAGELQRISAGTGVRHSEYNPSQSEPVHFLQIWILPERKGLEPGYEKRSFASGPENGLLLVGSPTGRDGSALIHRDVDLFCGQLGQGRTLEHRLETGRHAWIQVISGALQLNGVSLEPGDGAALSDEKRLKLDAAAPSRFLLFDLS
ncbi:quercetin 2,3-dioxygenase [Desulfuromonas versatilis]|uniref:Quercetin 2,3-dioxygenase n=1 Tax=Desulfuromonas versatilis TaxID=2802975 RepID=A0ABN6E329_9BACT|nr:pirin family protein [Desulfuromonas versatilis]BCR06755.1 quercetin 2,3-dioxygenase [Desulfuromonas versatilis]